MADRFLLDENIPSSVSRLLVRKGFQVRTVVESLGAGSTNGKIAEDASHSGEIIMTLDSDFLKLHPNPKARIIFVDVHPAVPATISQALEQHLDQTLQLLKTASKVKLTKSGPVAD